MINGQFIFETIIFTMFMSAVFFIAFIFNKYYRVYRSNYFLKKTQFTNDQIEKIKGKVKSFEESKKNEMINKMAKLYMARDYNSDIQDDYIEILDSMRSLCEGALSDYYDPELIRIMIGKVLEEYLINSTKYNIISNTEEYITIELLLKDWKNKNNMRSRRNLI